MSVQEQIDRIKGNVAEAYAAVADMGGTLPEQQDTANLPEAVRSIPAGGGPGPSGPLDPWEVYENTRPTDWLPMPDPEDDEMYLLFHIPDGVSSLLAFTATCTGSYTVALGTVAGGKFVQHSAVSVASGDKYEAELFANDFGDLTSDGMKQCMVKVSGTAIKTWEPSTHSKKTAPTNFAGWSIVEIACALPSGTGVKCGNRTQNLALKALRYFSWHGVNQATDMFDMFSYCRSLITVLQLDTTNVGDMGSMFSGCYSLAAVPQLDTAKAINMNNMFYYCNALTSIPELDTANVGDMGGMFYGCYALAAIPQLDTSEVYSMSNMFSDCRSLITIPQLDTTNVRNMGSMFSGCYSLAAVPQLNTANASTMKTMFYGCYALAAIPQLDTASAINMGSMFGDCYALAKLTFDPTATGWAGYAVSLTNCSLGHAALVEFFKSLPAITASKAITLTGNPGVSELTDAEKAIATNKNWTLTL